MFGYRSLCVDVITVIPKGKAGAVEARWISSSQMLALGGPPIKFCGKLRMLTKYRVEAVIYPMSSMLPQVNRVGAASNLRPSGCNSYGSYEGADSQDRQLNKTQ